MHIKIATRNSPLALWQAEYVQSLLENAQGVEQVEIIGMTTRGDQILDRSLLKVGGKGLFMKELEEAIVAGRADIAVHSMKDVTLSMPEGLDIEVVCEREKPNDAFVSNNYDRLDQLPAGSIVGTSSLRRISQLKHHFPELKFRQLRGNVNSRLAKLDNGEYDAIVLASAGLMRLGFDKRIKQHIPFDICLPAVGQGIVGIQTRIGDDSVNAVLAQFNNAESAICIAAERSLNRALEGGCSVPIAGHAVLSKSNESTLTLSLTGVVGDAESGELIKEAASIAVSNLLADISLAEELGVNVANALKKRGAAELIDKSLAFDDEVT